MNNNLKKAFIILCLSLNACTSPEKTNNGISIINIADNIGEGYLLNISEIAENVEYIPLETNDSSIIGNIRNIYFSNGFFILKTYSNSSGIFKLFDKKGQFYNTLNRQGRGPQDYASVYCLDLYKNSIVLLTVNKIIEYSFDGKFTRSIPLELEEAPSGFSRFKKLDDSHYLLIPRVSLKYQCKYTAIIIDSASKPKLLFKYPDSEIEIAKNRVKTKSLSDASTFSNEGVGKVITGNNEFIMSHDKEFKNIDTVYKINYGKYQITKFNVGKSTKNSDLINLSNPILESNNFIFFNLVLRALAHKPMKIRPLLGRDNLLPFSCAVYDKRDGSFRLIDQSEDYQKGFIEDFEGGPAFWPNYISDDEYMVSFVNASEFIQHAQTHKVSDKFKKIADGLTENNNPVVVLVKLKK